MKNIILASKSIDRGKILHNALIPFDFLLTYVDEEKFKQEIVDPVDLVRKIAEAKVKNAKNIVINEKKDAIIIAADTMVEINGEIIGKAANVLEAFSTLKKLVGKTHSLLTGIAITETYNDKIIVDHDITKVTFLDLSDQDIKNYVKTGEWKGRAGAYSINDKASLIIESIHGSPTNVIGLPLYKIFSILKDEFDTNLFDSE